MQLPEGEAVDDLEATFLALHFSNAIKKAYEMTDPDETLILVSADHSHVFTIAGYPHRGNPILGLVKSVPAVDGNPTSLDGDANGLPYTTLSYANGPGYRSVRPNLTNVDTAQLEFLQEATVPLGAETHAGEDVPIYAAGAGSWLFHGVQEQSYVYHAMVEALGWDPGRKEARAGGRAVRQRSGGQPGAPGGPGLPP